MLRRILLTLAMGVTVGVVGCGTGVPSITPLTVDDLTGYWQLTSSNPPLVSCISIVSGRVAGVDDGCQLDDNLFITHSNAASISGDRIIITWTMAQVVGDGVVGASFDGIRQSDGSFSGILSFSGTVQLQASTIMTRSSP